MALSLAESVNERPIVLGQSMVLDIRLTILLVIVLCLLVVKVEVNSRVI